MTGARARDFGIGSYPVVLEGVSMAAVHHQYLLLALLLQCLLSCLNALSVIVGALTATAENHEAVLVTGGTGDGCKTLLGHTHEVVGARCRETGVDSNGEGAISAVLETDREGDTGGELTVELGFGGTGTNGSEGETVGKELYQEEMLC